MSRAGRTDRARPATRARAEPAAPSREDAEGDLTPVVGRNLKRFRSERGLSLEALARVSGVSRAMLGQIELGQSTPTINVVWKISRALDVPFSALISNDAAPSAWFLPRSRARVLTSKDGAFRSRALFPVDRPRNVEFYELTLAPGGREDAEPHPPGTTENLVVSEGRLGLVIDDDRRLLEAGDAIFFEADVPHAYENIDPERPTVMFLVMTYPQKV